MKILLISDTHGNIDEIPIKSILSKADICIHTGDFGFYNTKSVKALTQKEIQLQIKHSKLHDLEKEKLLTSSLAKKENAIVNNKILGNFDEYLYNNRLLNIPTYAIFGNHDDVKVVYNLKSNPIPNLHIVEENNFYKFADFYLTGVSGNCTLNNNFILQKSNCKELELLKKQGSQCRVASTLFNYIKLIETVQKIPKDKKIILMFHPSSIEETFLELVSWQCNAAITLSGHMGHMDGSKAFTDHTKLPKLQDCYQQLLSMYPSYKKELEIFRPQEKNWIIEHVNLPDSKDGYGLLEINNSNFNIQIYGRSYHSKLKDTLGDNLYEEIIESKNIEGKNLSIFSAKIQKIITKEINDKETISAILNQLLTFSHIWSFQKLFFNCCEAIIEDYPKLVNKLYDIAKNVYGITSTENW